MIKNLYKFANAKLSIEFDAKKAEKVNNDQPYPVKNVKADIENTN